MSTTNHTYQLRRRRRLVRKEPDPTICNRDCKNKGPPKPKRPKRKSILIVFSSDSESDCSVCDQPPAKFRKTNDKIASTKSEDDDQSRGPESANRKPASQVEDDVSPESIENELPWIDRISPEYDVGEVIGHGAYGIVRKGSRRIDSMPVAIKVIPKLMVDDYGEIEGNKVPIGFELLKKASGHPGVIEMIDWFESKDHFILIMERPSPVIDLFDYRMKFGYVSEETARTIISQVAGAVLHCHFNGVVHRDIKDENVLLNKTTMKVKLIDFGCGAPMQASPHKELGGTPIYAPPEWLQTDQYNGTELDAWMIGCLLYMLVENSRPFEREREIVSGDVVFDREDLSENCKDLILKILRKDPRKRLRIFEILRHKWFYGDCSPNFKPLLHN